MSLVEHGPKSITARVNVHAYARRRLYERIVVCGVFAGTMAFVALPSFGLGWSIAIIALALGAGVTLAVLRHTSSVRSMESETDFDGLRKVAEVSGGGAATPEERLEAFDSIRFLTGDLVEGTSEPPPPEPPPRD